MKKRIDYDMLMLLIVSICFLFFVVVLAVYMDDKENEKLKSLEQPTDTVLVTTEDSIHAYEDGM